MLKITFKEPTLVCQGNLDAVCLFFFTKKIKIDNVVGVFPIGSDNLLLINPIYNQIKSIEHVKPNEL